MKVNLNPGTVNIEIPYGEIKVLLILRNSTSEEYCNFLRSRFKFGTSGNLMEDHSSSARIDFIDRLLLDIKVKDKEGNIGEAVFTDPVKGMEKPLTPKTPDWKKFVLPSFKHAAALVFEGVNGKMENAVLKN
ncbi:MAG: hypothetical protein VW455_02300 [Nitrospinota bacterium]